MLNKNHIFSMSRSTQNQNNEMYYSVIGKQDFLDDSGFPRIEDESNPNVIAKAIPNKKPKHFTDKQKFYRYYIKMGPNLELFNPIELHSSVKEKQSKFAYINNSCKHEWIFKEIDKALFDQYINFLKSPNAKSLKDIQRQIV